MTYCIFHPAFWPTFGWIFEVKKSNFGTQNSANPTFYSIPHRLCLWGSRVDGGWRGEVDFSNTPPPPLNQPLASYKCTNGIDNAAQNAVCRFVAIHLFLQVAVQLEMAIPHLCGIPQLLELIFENMQFCIFKILISITAVSLAGLPSLSAVPDVAVER